MKMSIFLIEAILIICSVFSSKALADFTSASNRGTIGDISNLYLSPDGFEINMMNNDFLGGTDKYMTGGMSVGWLKSFGRQGDPHVFSYELLVDWHAITPASQESVGGRALPRPLGRFADWMSGRGSFSYSVANAFGYAKLQLSLGMGHIGNKGMKNLHTSIHRGIGMQTSGLEYNNQPVGITRDYDLYLGEIFGGLGGQIMVGGGLAYDKAMSEIYVSGNYLRDLTTSTKVSLEGVLARQAKSEIYDAINPVRYELAVGIRIHEYYQPGFKFVSSFLKEDPQGQLYAELLRFNIPI